MTTCLEVTTFSGVINSLKVISLSEVTIFLTKIDCSIGITYLKGTGSQGAKTEDVSTSNTYIENPYIKLFLMQMVVPELQVSKKPIFQMFILMLIAFILGLKIRVVLVVLSAWEYTSNYLESWN